MTQAISVQEIFADAHQLHEQALGMLDQGDMRGAAEKAWCATKRATDALILARTGRMVTHSTLTSVGLKELSRDFPDVKALNLNARYYHVQGSLHGHCFYLGIFDPEEDEALIRRVGQYIDDAERLARSQ